MAGEDKASVLVRGPDAEELAAALRWPDLGDGTWGFRDLARAAAQLRELSARRAISRLSLDVVVETAGT